MREIRDKISNETRDMKFEEFKKHISERLSKTEVVSIIEIYLVVRIHLCL